MNYIGIALTLLVTFNENLGQTLSILPGPRMGSGLEVKRLKRFPHHVLIKDSNSSTTPLCGGSILNQRWILTSALCTDNMESLEIHFRRQSLLTFEGSFGIMVHREAVHRYPSSSDDIALIQLPFELIFTKTLRPIRIYSGSDISGGKYVVLPGFKDCTRHNLASTTAKMVTDGPALTTNTPIVLERSLSYDSTRECNGGPLIYRAFKLLDGEKCKCNNESFDSDLKYCTRAWAGAKNDPSISNAGSGLLVGWPANPRLIGIFNGFNDEGLALYTNVAKYSVWIDVTMHDGDHSESNQDGCVGCGISKLEAQK